MESFRLSSVCGRTPRHTPASLLLVEIFLHCLLLTVAICPSICLHPFIVYSYIFWVYWASGLLTPLAKHGTEKQPIGFRSQRNWVLILAPCLGLSLLSLHLVMKHALSSLPCFVVQVTHYNTKCLLVFRMPPLASCPFCLPSSDSAMVSHSALSFRCILTAVIQPVSPAWTHRCFPQNTSIGVSWLLQPNMSQAEPSSLSSKPLPPPVSLSGSGTTASHSPSWRLESSSTCCSPSPPTSQPLSLLVPPVHQLQSQLVPAALCSGLGHHFSSCRE